MINSLSTNLLCYSYPTICNSRIRNVKSEEKPANSPYASSSGVSFSGISKCVSGYPKHTIENYEGCLFGGAVGDAFGAKLERLSLDDIKHKFRQKVKYLLKDSDGVASVTDDTQMSLFTIDGLLKSHALLKNGQEKAFYQKIYNSYQDWLKTQTSKNIISDRGLLANPELYKKCAPGRTCLNALRSNVMGTISNPINKSTGNGGIMRTAPVGLLYFDTPEKAFEIGANIAAMTHGSPRAYLPAGYLSSLIAEIIKGKPIVEAMEKSDIFLKKYKGSDEVSAKIDKVKSFLKSDSCKDEDVIEAFHGGWCGDDALAIALYFSRKYQDSFKHAIIAAANHSGDSDTCAAITGNILGAYSGAGKIPSSYKNSLEFYNILKNYSVFLHKFSEYN